MCIWFQVYIWVLNDEEDFQRAFELGATGVMTDFPTRLKDFMDRNGIAKPQWPSKPPPSYLIFYYYYLLEVYSVLVISSLAAHLKKNNEITIFLCLIIKWDKMAIKI